jgi:uncharacterized protein (DUF433 family)
MNRPEIKKVGIEVHKIANQVWHKNIAPRVIVNDYYAQNGILEASEYDSIDNMYSDLNKDLPPKFTEDMVKDCLKYARKNQRLIDKIITEDEKLKNILFKESGVRNKEEIKKMLNKTDFNHFNIEFYIKKNGFNINWGQSR